MKSRGKSKNNSAWLIVLFVAVLAVLGGALLMLMDTDDGDPTDVTSTVGTPTVETTPAMEIEPVQRDTPEPSRLDVPSLVAPDPGSDLVMQIEDGTPTSRIEGRVVDPGGTPLAGAELRVYKGNPLVSVNFAGARPLLPSRAFSQADGSFVLDGIPHGKDYVLVGNHQDFARTELANLRVSRKQPTRGVELRMEEGATISGAVLVAAGGAPIADARVELYDTLVTVQTRPEDRKPWKIVFTDALGQFEFDHVAATSLRVRVEAPGYEAQSQTISYALEARAKDKDVEFRLNLGHSLGGQVVDDRGQPVPQARLEANALTKDYQGNVVAFSDANGYFLLDGLGEENFYQVRATAPGHSDQVVPKVQVSDGHVLVEMNRQLAAEGWVRDFSGQPIRTFELTLMRAAAGREPSLMNESRSFDAEDGYFLFDSLDPGSYALEAVADGFAPSHSESFVISRDQGVSPSVVISMGKGGTLQGKVFDAAGVAVENAIVKINPNNHVDSPILKIFSTLAPSKERLVQARTNAAGAYKITHISPGTYQVSVQHPDSAPRIMNDLVIIDDANGANPPLDLYLPPGSIIGGRVLDSSRQPLPFAEVQISQKSGFMEAATTDREGYFSFNNLIEGTYTLTLRPEKDRNNKPLNPLIRLLHAQKSRQDIFVAQGQTLDDIELYMGEIEGSAMSGG